MNPGSPAAHGQIGFRLLVILERATADAQELLDAAHEEAESLLDHTRQRCRQAVREARGLRRAVLAAQEGSTR